MKKYIGLITGLLPLITSAQLVMNGNYQVVMTGGTQANPTSIVLTNSAPSGITNNGTGWIVSENEFNQVDWNIGTNTGAYLVPFGYSTTDYLPTTCNVLIAGVGSGTVRFATYHGANWNNFTYMPAGVASMTDFSRANYSNDAVDRFWIMDAQGYTTNPGVDNTFTYIRSGASEIAVPNYIVENSLIAQRFNSSLHVWDDWTGITGSDVTSGNTGTVTSGLVPASGFYRSWCLFNDSILLTAIPPVIGMSTVVAYPNPSTGNFTVSGVTIGQVIELYNDLGQKLTSTVVDDATMRFDISTKANGMYLVRIQNKDGSIVTQKKLVKTQ